MNSNRLNPSRRPGVPVTYVSPSPSSHLPSHGADTNIPTYSSLAMFETLAHRYERSAEDTRPEYGFNVRYQQAWTGLGGPFPNTSTGPSSLAYSEMIYQTSAPRAVRQSVAARNRCEVTHDYLYHRQQRPSNGIAQFTPYETPHSQRTEDYYQSCASNVGQPRNQPRYPLDASLGSNHDLVPSYERDHDLEGLTVSPRLHTVNGYPPTLSSLTDATDTANSRPHPSSPAATSRPLFAYDLSPTLDARETAGSHATSRSTADLQNSMSQRTSGGRHVLRSSSNQSQSAPSRRNKYNCQLCLQQERRHTPKNKFNLKDHIKRVHAVSWQASTPYETERNLKDLVEWMTTEFDPMSQ